MIESRIVILGAGYGGIMTARQLQKAMPDSRMKITLVNNNDYHYQTTWLHENAAGTRHHEETKINVKDVINKGQIQLIFDEVTAIKTVEKQVKLKNKTIEYDILIIGLGFEAQFGDIKGIEDNAFTINNLNRARQLREHVHYTLAATHLDTGLEDAHRTIVIGGGGYTGVEYAAELADHLPELAKEYDVEKSLIRIIVLEETQTILPAFDEDLASYAMTTLSSKGVDIITNAKLMECRDDRVIYEKAGTTYVIPTKTMVWAAGVKANRLMEKAGFETEDGRVIVKDNLLALEHDDIFVLGDCAVVRDKETGNVYPPTAQIAVQEASVAANNVLALLNKQELAAFQPIVKDTIASLGHGNAVAHVANRKFFGWRAKFSKKMADNRYLYKLGGLTLLMKKGKFNLFN